MLLALVARPQPTELRKDRLRATEADGAVRATGLDGAEWMRGQCRRR